MSAPTLCPIDDCTTHPFHGLERCDLRDCDCAGACPRCYGVGVIAVGWDHRVDEPVEKICPRMGEGGHP